MDNNNYENFAALDSDVPDKSLISEWLIDELNEETAKEEALSYITGIIKKQYPDSSFTEAWAKYKEEHKIEN